MSARSHSAIDENQFKYSLDALCERYGLPGKDETVLREAVVAAGFASGPKKIVRVQEHIHRLPARYGRRLCPSRRGEYAASLEKLDPILDHRRYARRLSARCRPALPMVLEMRRRGVRIDQDAAEQASEHLLRKRDAALAELSAQLASRSAWPRSIAQNGRRRPLMPTTSTIRAQTKGNPSFTAGKLGWMAKHEHWLPQLIATCPQI